MWLLAPTYSQRSSASGHRRLPRSQHQRHWWRPAVQWQNFMHTLSRATSMNLQTGLDMSEHALAYRLEGQVNFAQRSLHYQLYDDKHHTFLLLKWPITMQTLTLRTCRPHLQTYNASGSASTCLASCSSLSALSWSLVHSAQAVLFPSPPFQQPANCRTSCTLLRAAHLAVNQARRHVC